jgi:hypothetical protein
LGSASGDIASLATMFNTGARVQELIDLSMNLGVFECKDHNADNVKIKRPDKSSVVVCYLSIDSIIWSINMNYEWQKDLYSRLDKSIIIFGGSGVKTRIQG